MASGGGKKNRQRYRGLSLSLTKDSTALLCTTPETSLAGTDVNEERVHLFLSDTETEPPNPPVDEKWGEEQRRPLFLPSARGGWGRRVVDA